MNAKADIRKGGARRHCCQLKHFFLRLPDSQAKMSEKGEKGGKSALKSPASKGKDKGRKVQFDSEDMFDEKFETNGNGKSNGKADGYSGKGKGGKGDKGGSGKKEPRALLLNVEQEIPENVTCLMDCEAAQILQGIQEHMVLLSKDPSIKIPISFDRALQYASRGNHYTDPHSVRKVLEPLKNQGVSDAEMCLIANTAVESVGEAFGLMPSLKAKKSKVKEPLKSALTELEKLKIVMESTKKAIVLD
ncbi:unnamed protein product [Lactuca virosa]|uniref:RNA polymerase Rpb4/RPC9 core domain-containing protein n=1 Tax=Lactuca virosa TaxID=75947 RepID=A0AAU9NPQ7_9ASTR|nr:unnamed protein product [Lactuca virosa]